MTRTLLSIVVCWGVAESAIQANMGPMPFEKKDAPPPVESEPGRPDPDEIRSPIPTEIAGLAAATGATLLGLWIANKGRSQRTQD